MGVVPCCTCANGVEDPPATEQAKAHVKASLICEHTSLTPGSTTTLGVALDIQKHWHLYWPGRNDSGQPPTADFELPTGYTVDAIQWPAPTRLVETGDILNHVYTDKVTLLVPVHVPSSAQPGTSVTIKAKLGWFVCESVCLLENGTVSIKIPIAKPGESVVPGPSRSPDAKRIDEARARMPRDLPKDFSDIKIGWNPKTVTVNVFGANHLTFYPNEDCVPFEEPIKDGDASSSIMTIRLGDPEKDHTALSGVLEIRREKDKPAEFFRINSTPGSGNTTPLPKPIGVTPKSPDKPFDPSTPPSNPHPPTP